VNRMKSSDLLCVHRAHGASVAGRQLRSVLYGEPFERVGWLQRSAFPSIANPNTRIPGRSPRERVLTLVWRLPHPGDRKKD
jgi:hypothetical protein